mgnify:CR=1 FL=1
MAGREGDRVGNGWASPRPRARPTGRAVSGWKVIKKHAPDKPGALKLATQWGDALVCVRHRLDESGQTRVTTVELVVEQAPVRARGAQVVGVQISYAEKDLQAAARAAGATWDAAARLWRMPEKVARALRLADRIRDGK